MNYRLSFRYLSSKRLLRVVLGSLLVVSGLLFSGSIWGLLLAVVGAVPVLKGLFNICLVGPLIGAPFIGSKA